MMFSIGLARPSAAPSYRRSRRTTGVAAALLAFTFLVGCDQSPTGPRLTEVPDAAALDDFAYEAALLIDEHRARLGCAPLTWHSGAAAVAENYARQMSEEAFFGHVDPAGTTLKQRLNRGGVRGYAVAAETIAAGQDYPQKVVADWIASSGHRQILEDCRYTSVGVGFYEGDGPYREYWTAIFVAG